MEVSPPANVIISAVCLCRSKGLQKVCVCGGKGTDDGRLPGKDWLTLEEKTLKSHSIYLLIFMMVPFGKKGYPS